jgi:tetratricopeptide (TPR) repeat protein
VFSRALRRGLFFSSAATLYLYNQWNTPTLHASTSPKISDIPKVSLSPYRPTDGLNLHYAVAAYKDDGGTVEPGWELIQTYRQSNSYFGAAYRHPHHKHIIIAHRGTQDLKDWLCDFKTIIYRLNEQEATAWSEFAKRIIEENGPTYTYSFTGHSLGGWLAESCLWKYQDEFVRDRSCAYQDAFSVTLDDPGGKEVLEALQPRTETPYKIDVNTLDRTNYVSRPNTINTALGREGATVYTLLPEISSSGFISSLLMRHTLFFTYEMHKSEDLLKEFDKDTGLPKRCYRVLDWPRVMWGKGLPAANSRENLLGYLAYVVDSWRKGDIQRGEYLGFYTYDSNTVNNPHTLPPISQFRLQHGVHYRTTPFQAQVLPLRNMPSVARKFLEELSHCSDRQEAIREVKGNIDSDFATLLNRFQVNAREELVLDGTTTVTARAFRERLLHFLSVNPSLCQTSLPVLRTASLSSRVQAIENEAVPGVIASLQEQSKRTGDLLYRLSFQYGTAQLYKLIKPTWEVVEQARAEAHALEQQFRVLQNTPLSLTKVADEKLKTQLTENIAQEMQRLTIAKQSAALWVMYLEENPGLGRELDSFISVLQKTTPGLPDINKTLLLNRAYNLKAKMVARDGSKALSAEHYKQATQLLPSDAITWSNYGGLLADLARAECKDPKRSAQLHLEAYRCYDEHVSPYLNQFKPEQRPVVYSGMAYELLLLAQCIEKKQIIPTEAKVPTAEKLRAQAQDLLKQAIQINSTYLNARLFSAILAYDEKRYSNALQAVNNALSLQPDHSTALMRKGFILEKLGELEEALNFLGRAKQKLEMTDKGGGNQGFIQEINEHIESIQAQLQRHSATARP